MISENHVSNLYFDLVTWQWLCHKLLLSHRRLTLLRELCRLSPRFKAKKWEAWDLRVTCAWLYPGPESNCFCSMVLDSRCLRIASSFNNCAPSVVLCHVFRCSSLLSSYPMLMLENFRSRCMPFGIYLTSSPICSTVSCCCCYQNQY